MSGKIIKEKIETLKLTIEALEKFKPIVESFNGRNYDNGFNKVVMKEYPFIDNSEEAFACIYTHRKEDDRANTVDVDLKVFNSGKNEYTRCVFSILKIRNGFVHNGKSTIKMIDKIIEEKRNILKSINN